MLILKHFGQDDRRRRLAALLLVIKHEVDSPYDNVYNVRRQCNASDNPIDKFEKGPGKDGSCPDELKGDISILEDILLIVWSIEDTDPGD